MTYKETLDWMFTKLPMYQRQGKTAFKKDLTNTLALSDHLHNPHEQFKSIHVAGTNGKGSTSHMIASILQEAGFKVGLYTSPHLKDFRERIKVNGKPIAKKSVINFINKNQLFLDKQQLSFFEMTVGMAFDHFAKEQIDMAVVEVGLGGRLDSTNIITPEVSVITNIGYDHTQFLGETLSEIAFEKAGIIKYEVPVIIGEKQEEVLNVFNDHAVRNKSELSIAETEVIKDYKTDLLGKYQKQNLKTAVQTVKVLISKCFAISEKHIEDGLLKVTKNTNLLGRWQQIGSKPTIICDAAHNREGLIYVLNQLSEEEYRNLHIILGVVNDKKLETILNLFPETAVYYFCKPDIPRGLDAKILKEKAANFSLKGEVYSSVIEALNIAKNKANKDDLIFVGGSTFVVAEVV
ncbi:MAG: folylpolyglutamate synthase/dihydrofolate synthase family protein [Aureibaculum sp.]|nr:folylpolyglutamate synthase/dihydrofolate synthase family protein [Aureibaculum sp.]